MRHVPLALLLAATTLVTTPALADVGPPPACAAGTHRQYLFGNHCVPDGFHLEQDPAGGTKTVPDNAAASPVTPAPSAGATGFASPPPSPTAPAADPSPVPAAPPASRGCACGVAEMSGSAAGVLAGVAALAALLRRRRPR
jgi:MYXO-CTERM domain-containing protein